jgi:putative solute:sodium symporter small subunit
MAIEITEKHKEYWQKNLRLTGILLFIWFATTFVIGYYAKELSTFSIFGWPFSFYMAAQGSLIAFVVMCFWNASAQNKIDEEFGVQED